MQLWLFNDLRINDLSRYQTANLLYHPRTFHILKNQVQLFIAQYDQCIIIPRLAAGLRFIRIAYFTGKHNFDNTHIVKPVRYGDLNPSTFLDDDDFSRQALQDLLDCQRSRTGFGHLKNNIERHGHYFDVTTYPATNCLQLLILFTAAQTRSNAYYYAIHMAHLRALWLAHIAFRPPPDLRKTKELVPITPPQHQQHHSADHHPVRNGLARQFVMSVVDFFKPLVRPALLRGGTVGLTRRRMKQSLQPFLSSVRIIPAQYLLDDPANEYQSSWFEILKSAPTTSTLDKDPLCFPVKQLPILASCSFCHGDWDKSHNIFSPTHCSHMLHMDCALRSYYNKRDQQPKGMWCPMCSASPR